MSKPRIFLLCLLLALMLLLTPVHAYKNLIIKYGFPEDKTIRSESFPQSYPEGVNMTWSWDVGTGMWGVLLPVFDLDPGPSGTGDGDKLTIMDKEDRSRTIHYSYSNPPVVDFISKGSKLEINFVSDKRTSAQVFQGFEMLILYGVTETELTHKRIEAKRNQTPTPENSKKDDGESQIQLITAVSLIVVFVAIILLAAVFTKRGKSILRRASTMISGRSARSQSAVSGLSIRGAAGPASPASSASYMEAGFRPGTVQRSNSQLDWSARACATMQTRGSLARPNDYIDPTERSRPAEQSHETNIKYTIRHDGGAAGISVSGTITSSSDRTAASGDNGPNGGYSARRDRLVGCRQHSEDAEPKPSTHPRGLRKVTCLKKSQSLTAGREAEAAAREQHRGRPAASMSELTPVHDDSDSESDLEGVDNFVDTIDNCNPIPLDGIRGKLPRRKSSDHDLDYMSSPPPSYESQCSTEDAVCSGYDADARVDVQSPYVNVSLLPAKYPTPEGTPKSRSRDRSNEALDLMIQHQAKGTAPTRTEYDDEYIHLTVQDYPESNNLRQGGSGSVRSLNKSAVDIESLNQIIPVLKTDARVLNSAYDKPPSGSNDCQTSPPKANTSGSMKDSVDRPYDFPIPSQGSSSVKDPHSSGAAFRGMNTTGNPFQPFLQSNKDYDFPPKIGGDYDIPVRSGGDYDIPPSSDNHYDFTSAERRNDNQDFLQKNGSFYDFPPQKKPVGSIKRGNQDYDLPPPRRSGDYDVLPNRGGDYDFPPHCEPSQRQLSKKDNQKNSPLSRNDNLDGAPPPRLARPTN